MMEPPLGRYLKWNDTAKFMAYYSKEEHFEPVLPRWAEQGTGLTWVWGSFLYRDWRTLTGLREWTSFAEAWWDYLGEIIVDWLALWGMFTGGRSDWLTWKSDIDWLACQSWVHWGKGHGYWSGLNPTVATEQSNWSAKTNKKWELKNQSVLQK